MHSAPNECAVQGDPDSQARCPSRRLSFSTLNRRNPGTAPRFPVSLTRRPRVFASCVAGVILELELDDAHTIIVTLQITIH